MNETFAKVLQFVIIFWLIVGGLSIIFSKQIGTYFIEDDAINNIKETNSLSGITALWNIATFKVTEQVPIGISIILDIIALLSILALIMAVTNR